jgi:predicted enzyme related to lactoylglutathione lyase
VSPRSPGAHGSYAARVEITKTYFMLPVQDMDRAVSFYRDAVGLALDFQSPFWSELRWHDATVALHPGASGEERESWLGFHVADLDGAVTALEHAGGHRRGNERAEGNARLQSVVDPDGNILTLGQDGA